MIPEPPQAEYAYSVKLETAKGQITYVPVVFLSPQEVESFLQTDFNRLVQEAGLKGARIHVERAMTADYDKVLRDVAACLHTAATQAPRSPERFGEREPNGECAAKHVLTNSSAYRFQALEQKSTRDAQRRCPGF